MAYNTFDEYLAVVENTVKLSDRRQTVNDILVGLNVVFATGVSYLIINTHFQAFWVASFVMFLCLATLPINTTWLALNHRYRKLILLRINYLLELEQQFRTEQHNDRIGVHHRELEDAKKFQLENGRESVGFSMLERRFILFFLILFPLIGVVTLGITTAIHLGYLPTFTLS